MDKKDRGFKGQMPREYLAVTFFVLWLWQIFLVQEIFGVAPQLARAWSDLGVSLSGISGFYVLHHRWFLILPVITMILAADLLGRKPLPRTYAVTAFAFISVCTLVLQIFLRKAFIDPFIDIIQKIG